MSAAHLVLYKKYMGHTEGIDFIEGLTFLFCHILNIILILFYSFSYSILRSIKKMHLKKKQKKIIAEMCK